MDEDLKRCSRCGDVSLKSNFNKDRKSKGGLRPHCIDCRQKIYLKIWRKLKYIMNKIKREEIDISKTNEKRMLIFD